MICIGVYGKKTDSFMKQLSKRYLDADMSAALCFKGTENVDDAYMRALAMGRQVFITNSLNNAYIAFDIVVFFSCAKHCDINIKCDGYAVINADDCVGLKNTVLSAGVTRITCGINSKAGVTISAVGENKDGVERIQCCVQHKIRTMSGRIIEPQEFAVYVRGINYPMSEVLSLITTAIAGDIEQTVTAGTLISVD